MSFVHHSQNNSKYEGPVVKQRLRSISERTGAPASAFHIFKVQTQEDITMDNPTGTLLTWMPTTLLKTLHKSAHSLEGFSDVVEKLDVLAKRVEKAGDELSESTFWNLMEMVDKANQELDDAGVAKYDLELKKPAQTRTPSVEPVDHPAQFVNTGTQTNEEVIPRRQRQRKRPNEPTNGSEKRAKKTKVAIAPASPQGSPPFPASVGPQAPTYSGVPRLIESPQTNTPHQAGSQGAYMLLPVTNTVAQPTQLQYPPLMPYYYTPGAYGHAMPTYHTNGLGNGTYKTGQ